MKKGLKLFTLAFTLMFAITVKVKAETITTWEDLKTCLTTAGTATCQTEGKITAAAENITVVGDKTLILGDTLTIANRFKVDTGTKLTVKGNVTAGQYMFMAEAGSTLKLESGVFTSTSRNANSANVAMIVSVFGAPTSGSSKTYVEVGKNVEFRDGGIAIYQDRTTGKAAYGVVVDFYGKMSMTKNGDVKYNVFTVLGNIKQMTGEDLPTINIYEGATVTNEDAPAIYGAGYAIWNIKGGTFTGSEALSIKSGKFNITGGTFIGTGAQGMAQSFSDSEQGVVAISVGNQSAGTKIVLKDKSGKTIIEHSPELNFAVVILSSPDIKKGETYTLTVGSESGEFEAS